MAMLVTGPATKVASLFLEDWIAMDGTLEIGNKQGRCISSNEYKASCKNWKIKHDFYSPTMHVRTGLVEKRILTIKSLNKTFIREEIAFMEAITRTFRNMQF